MFTPKFTAVWHGVTVVEGVPMELPEELAEVAKSRADLFTRKRPRKAKSDDQDNA